MTAPEIPAAIRKYWEANPAAVKPNADDLDWMEQTWGGSLPPDYRAFLETYGHVSLEDADGVPRWITYERDDDGMSMVEEISLWTFLSRTDMTRARAWLFEDAEAPRLPPGYIAFASGGGFSYFLLRLGAEPSPVYVWPEADDPWGEGDNTALGHAADSLEAFFQNLRVE